jgi:hypothetical protein
MTQVLGNDLRLIWIVQMSRGMFASGFYFLRSFFSSFFPYTRQYFCIRGFCFLGYSDVCV